MKKESYTLHVAHKQTISRPRPTAILRRIAVVVVGLFLVTGPGLRAEDEYVLSGRVVTQDNAPLSNVLVRIAEYHVSTVSNEKGEYNLHGLHEGSYLVEFSHTGYRSYTHHVKLEGQRTELNVQLQQTVISTPTVNVTAAPMPSEWMHTPSSAAIVEGRALEDGRGQSLGETIQNVPGVNGFSSGPLQVKPVLRGLSDDRVLVLQDGLRHEAQTWDEPQTPEIDGMDAQRIEIVRGAESVLYGADAIGGVVNVIHPDLFQQQSPTLEGRFSLNAFSNNGSAAAGLDLHGKSSAWFYRVHATGRLADDYSAPAGSVPYWTPDTTGGLHYQKSERVLPSGAVFNTGAQEFSASGSVGTVRDWGTVQFDYSHYGQKFFIHPEPGRLEYELNINTMNVDTLPASPLQEVMHERAVLRSVIPFADARLSLCGSFQYDQRREEGVTESDADEVKKEELGIPAEVQLDLYTMAFKADLELENIVTIGIDVDNQRNQSLGMKALIPEYTATNLGAFLYSKQELFSGMNVSAALRYDTKALAVAERRTKDTAAILLNNAQDKSYSNLSAQLGLNYAFSNSLSITANLGTGWRAPVVAELYTFGRDEGEIQYKVGNDSLGNEQSQNIEINLRYHSDAARVEINAYRNHISDFIYLQPTTTISDGVFEYFYRQADATFVGGELSAEFSIGSSFVIGAGADMVRAEFDASGHAVPRIPAARVLGSLSYLSPEFLGLQNFRLSINPRFSMEQSRIDSLEFVVPSYFLLGASVGGDLHTFGSPLHVALVADNILNQAYFDNLSRYRQLALNPGINIALKLSVPFGIVE